MTIKEQTKNLVEYVMKIANSIDDYDWGQDGFQKDLTEKIDTLL